MLQLIRWVLERFHMIYWNIHAELMSLSRDAEVHFNIS